LDNFLDELGGAASTTTPSSFEGQGYRYLNGGQAFVRVPTREVQVFGYRAPNYRAGCGGIDMYGGGFAFLDAEEIVGALKDIGSNAASYAFMLALRTISSQISNTLGENFDWLLKNQSMSFNTCERAQWAVNSALSGQMLGNQTNSCITHRTSALGETYTEARDACSSSGGEQAASLDNDEARASSFIEGNLTWIIMEEANMFATDVEMREMVMSVTGTVVKSKRDSSDGLAPGDEDAITLGEWKPSLLSTDEGLLQGILQGSEAVSIYRCDTSAGKYACQDPEVEDMVIDPSVSIYQKVNGQLIFLFDAIKDKSTLVLPESTEIVQKTSLPVHRMLAVAASLNGSNGLDLVNKYTEAVALDILYTYISQIHRVIQDYASDPQWGDQGKTLSQHQKDILKEVRSRKLKAASTAESAMKVAEELQYYERLILSSMPKRLAEAYLWDSGSGAN